MGLGGCGGRSHDVEERLIRCFDPVSAIDHSTAGGAGMRHKANFAAARNWYYRSSANLAHDCNPGLALTQNRPRPPQNYGLRSGGSGGSSRINVMVTRRLAGSVGSSGNSGWASALPETEKMCEAGSPSRSRIWRTTLARSAERSNAP